MASEADRDLFMRDGSFVEETPISHGTKAIEELVRVEDPARRR